MISKRRLSKSDDLEDPGAASKIKKRRASNKKQKAQDDSAQSDSVFTQLLSASGMTLASGEQQNELAVDQSVFQKSLQQMLRKHPRYPHVMEEFVRGLASHIEERQRFRNCLLPCGRSNAEEDASQPVFTSFHDSLMKLLLGIEQLQEDIITLLFEKLPEYLYDSSGNDGISLPRLIINQLKYLQRLATGRELTSRLMQLLVVAPGDLQHHIISSLPEILEDTEHDHVAKELSILLKQNTQLTVPVLDAFSSLSLNAELLAEVREWVMSSLSAVDLDVVPVIVKFILHSVTLTDAVEVISELRRKLDVESCVLPSQILATQGKGGNKTSATGTPGSSVTLLMEVIKSAVCFQKHVCDAWIKAIEDVESAEEHKVTDLFVLLVLYTSNTNSKKRVERVLRSKIRSGHISKNLLHRAFRNHSQVMVCYFSSALSLAQTLLRSAEPSVVPFTHHLYTLSFSSAERYSQQELIGALVTHVCSGYAEEVDTALDIILDLVSAHTSSLAVYGVFIKGIMDYLDNLNAHQIRKLFHILCTLAFSQEGLHLQDELHIVIRKHLSSTVLKYKRIGVIGAVRMVGSMAATNRQTSVSDGCEKQGLSGSVFRQVTALLELARTCCEQSSDSAVCYYDELADLVQRTKLDPQVMEYLRKSVVDDFQEDYVLDLDQAVEGSHMFPVKAMYNLEEDESQSAVVINLLPLLSNHIAGNRPDVQRARLTSVLCLSPFFRLLRLCIEDECDGNLDEIDALLGCPVYMTDLDVLEKVDSLSRPERDFLCSLLFLAVNWFREVVNAFCKQSSPDMKGKVLTRLQNIAQLQMLLEKCLAGSVGYSPPSAHCDCEEAEAAAPVLPAFTAKKTRTGKKPLTDAKTCSDSTQVEQTQKSQPDKEDRGALSLSSFRPYLRELDLEVFTVLHSALLTRSLLDSNMRTQVRDVVQLGPAELLFLLDDLSRKMENILSDPKRAAVFKGKGSRSSEFSHLHQRTPHDVAQAVIQLLNPLCDHVENMHNYFQVEKHAVMDLQEHQYMISCYQLLLQILHTLFAWSGLSRQDTLLRAALGILVTRLKEAASQLDLDTLVRHGFSYFQNLCSSVPSLSCALRLTQLLITLTEKSQAAQYQQQMAGIVKRFLCQSWIQPSGEHERGVRHNESVQTLLCIYLQYVDVPEAVEEICGVAVPELMNAAKDGRSSSFPTLSRQTFVVYFRVLMEKLEKCVRSIPVGKKSDSPQVQTEQLLRWSLAIKNFHILVNLVKVLDSRPMLSACLKYGRQFVETFLRLGMPLLDCCFKKHRDDVQSLLKILQLCTRQLHHVCGHSKIHQDTGLTTHVPLLKKTLEMFVYRVKAMMVLNHCQEAFWMGNLKNRDLQGEEIVSQTSQDSDTEEESQLPAEEPQEDSQEEWSDGGAQESEEAMDGDSE